MSQEKTKAVPASHVLEELIRTHYGDRIRIGDIVGDLGDRAFGLMLLICAIPVAVPNPIPGISAFLGLPLIFISGQFALGFKKPWLPAFLRDKTLPATDFKIMLAKMLPSIKKAERLLHPRLAQLTTPIAVRLLGFLCLIHSIILALPIPLANMAPAIAIVILSLALLTRDGAAIIVGLIASAVAFAITSAVIFTAIEAAIAFVHAIF